MATFGVGAGAGGDGGGGLVQLAAVATTSGTAHDVATGIPDDAVFVAVTLRAVSANTANQVVVKLGTSGGIVSTGYSGAYTTANQLSETAFTSGFAIDADPATAAVNGTLELRRVGDSNKWVASFTGTGGANFALSGGEVTLSAALDRVQVTLATISGNANLFDAGEVAVQYSTKKGVGPIATTDNLPEGSTNRYFSDALARGAISAQAGAVVAYNSTTGVFSTNGTALNNAIDTRLSAANLSSLADVGTATPATGDILVRGTQSYDPTGIEDLVQFANGTNTTVSTAVSAAGVLTVTVNATATGGGGSGISTIGAATDTDFSDLLNGDIPVYNSTSGKWENLGISDVVGVVNSGANVTLGTALDGGVLSISANVADGALSLAKLTAGGATSGHVLTVSSDGNTVSAAAASGGGGGSFSPSNTTATISAADRIAVWHGGTAGLNTIGELQIDFQPFHLSKKIFSGYRYSANALTAKGYVRAYTSGTSKRVQIACLDNDFRALSQLATPGAKFSYYIQSNIYEVVVLNSVQVAENTINLVEMELSVDALVGTFSNDQNVSIKYEGKAILFSDLEQTIGTGADRDAMLAVSRKGVHDAIPVKASAADLAEGADDAKFVTSRGARAIVKSVDDGSQWAGFTYVTGSTPGASQFTITGTNATGWVFTFNTTDANATQIDAVFGENSKFRITKDATNQITGEAQYAWRNPGTNVVAFKAKPNATEVGDVRSGSVTLHGTGGLYEELRDQGMVVSSDFVNGTDISITVGSDDRITINYTGTGGGGGTFATQGTANAGSSTNTIMSPATTHGVIEHLAHVADYTGFQHQASINADGTNLARGHFHINSAGTTAYFRGHTETEGAKMTAEILVDRSCIIERDGSRLDFDFTDATNVAISGSGNSDGVTKCTITNHEATPANASLTGDFSLYFLPEQNKQILEHAPKGSIKGIALAKGAVGPREAEGLFQKTISKLSTTDWIELQGSASTRLTFTTSTTGNDNESRARMFAIAGTGAANTASFNKIVNHTLIPGTITHSAMRALDGGHYSCRMDGIGTFYCHTTARHGLEVGMQFRHKAIDSNTWGSWQDCKLEDIAETIGGSSVTTYDVSQLFGSTALENVQRDTASGNARLASLFREKRVSGNSSDHLDVAPPFFASFGVGEGEVFPVTNRDYQFRFVFACPDFGNNASRIRKIYDYTEILTTDRL